MVDHRFAFITIDGVEYQVLKFDEDGNPIDWDEEATAEKVKDASTA